MGTEEEEDNDGWCDNDQPVEEDVIVVNADYIPNRWEE